MTQERFVGGKRVVYCLRGQQFRLLSPVMSNTTVKTIHAWQVVGDDRVLGELQDAGRPTGRRVMTSSVVRVVFQGEPPAAVAITASGSHYRLGTALDSATPAAQEFLVRKSRRGTPDAPGAGHPTEYPPLQ